MRRVPILSLLLSRPSRCLYWASMTLAMQNSHTLAVASEATTYAPRTYNSRERANGGRGM